MRCRLPVYVPGETTNNDPGMDTPLTTPSYMSITLVFLSLSFAPFQTNFWATVCKTVRPYNAIAPLSCPVCLCVTLVHCGQTVRWIKMPLGTEVGLGPWRHCVRWGSSSPKKGAQRPPLRPVSIVAKWSSISACPRSGAPALGGRIFVTPIHDHPQQQILHSSLDTTTGRD